MKNPNEESGSSDQENENSPPEDSQEPDSSLPEEESLNRDTEAGFEEQEGEVLPPEEKKKSGPGKIFIFIVLILSGSGGYLYFNNLIPPEILNLDSPKPIPSSSPALVAKIPPPSPPFVEESVAKETLNDTIVVQEPPPALPEEETHISGTSDEIIPTVHLSGTGFDEGPVEGPAEESSEELRALENPVAEQGVTEEQEEQEILEELESEAVTSSLVEISPPEEPSEESSEPVAKRDEAIQAYLDFIESSVQKLGGLIKQGFNASWDYIKS
jgi:hypothetical protein